MCVDMCSAGHYDNATGRRRPKLIEKKVRQKKRSQVVGRKLDLDPILSETSIASDARIVYQYMQLAFFGLESKKFKTNRISYT